MNSLKPVADIPGHVYQLDGDSSQILLCPTQLHATIPVQSIIECIKQDGPLEFGQDIGADL